ncbi:nonribosomal peptide synthase [Penicillium paradoxum]|uniref:nonribosomal peptide synthase n=1 Tax=Penicillium paradoxum TaxID=176176 RepID=UPI00254939C0|nr:nonribosomal peptide synthase [Penicillium paradoxum]KAJ5794579.1 nonribosomal peptide synthase [Penicillium paradoxum]
MDNINGNAVKEKASYWAKYLASTEPCQFPTRNDGLDGENQRKELPMGIETLEMREFCKSQEISPINVFHLAWAMVLRSYARTESVSFGYQTNGLGLHEDENSGIVLPFAVKIREDLTIAEALRNIAADYSLGLEHRNEWLSDEATSFHTKLVLYTSLGVRQQEEQLDNAITLHITDAGADILASLEFWTVLLSEGQASNVIHTLQRAVFCILHSPHEEITAQDLFSEAHRAQVWGWHQTRPELVNSCMHEFVCEKFNQRYRETAVSAWDGELTYQQLGDLSSSLAHHLVSLGAGPEVLIPVLLEKSVWVPVVLLGIWKAGAAIVPLDPSSPITRLRDIFMEAKATILVASPTQAERMSQSVDNFVVVDEQLFQMLPKYSEAPVSSVTPQNTAYVSFTSGSTGRPKGICVENAAFASALRRLQGACPATEASRSLQFASHSFSPALYEIFMPLVAGGVICLPSEEARRNNLVETLNEMRITWAVFTPSLLKELNPDEIQYLESIVLVGEPLSRFEAAPWVAKIHVVFCYASSENGLMAFNDQMGQTSDVRNVGHSDVGWVVDPNNHDRLVPIGVVGELLVHSPVTARGYLNDPEKTAAVFIDRPPWFDPSLQLEGRFCKTGDLMAYNSDGSLSFVGRKDFMIKVRGQRVEMGEVERRLAHPRIKQSIVLFPDSGPCKRRLVATVSLQDLPLPKIKSQRNPLALLEPVDMRSSAEWVDAMRAQMSRDLPSYMIPEIWVLLESLPLTLSGKADRQKTVQWLEAMDDETYAYITALGEEEDVDEQETPMEQLLRQIWGQVLARARVPRNRSFLSLGGDSISGMSVLSQCRRAGVKLTFQDILRAQNVSELAERAIAALEAKGSEDSDLVGDELTSEKLITYKDALLEAGVSDLSNVEDLYLCSPVQEGIILSQGRISGHYWMYVIWEAVPSHGQAISIERLTSAWSDVVDRHPILRTRFVRSPSGEAQLTQVVVKSSEVSVIHQQTKEPSFPGGFADTQLVAESGNLHQLTIMTNDSGQMFCKLEMSHAIVDALSFPIILGDLGRAYASELVLQPAAPRYSEYIAHIHKGSLEHSIEYWKDYLIDATPCHFPSLGGTDSAADRMQSLEVDTGIPAATLHSFCRRYGITLSNVFQLAWALVLRAYTGSDDVSFGYLTSGRDAPIEGIMEHAVGPYINMLVCHLNLDERADVRQLMLQIQSTFLDSLPHQNCSLANIQHALSLSGQALFNTAMSVSRVVPDKVTITDGTSFQITELYDPTEYQVSVNVGISSDKVDVRFNYWSSWVGEIQATHIASTFTQTLRSIAQGLPDQKIGDVNLLSELSINQISTWNSVNPELVDECIHHLITHQADRQPHHPAIESWDGIFSYAQLDDLSSRLAHYLVGLDVGIGPETMIPLCFEKSIWTAVAMLGVLKAGAVCCMLDPSHPVGRLRSIIDNIKAPAVLTDGMNGLDTELLSEICTESVVVNAGFVNSLPKKHGPANTSVRPDNAAFVVFTSGSTGTPKGIVIEHRAIASSSRAHGTAMKLNGDARVLQFASYIFDVAIQDHCTTLMRGGTIVKPSEYERMNDLPGAMKRLQANWANLTPTVASLLLPEDVNGLNVLALGGERIRQETVDSLSNSTNLTLIYGPAECSMTMSANFGVRPHSSSANFGFACGSFMWLTEINNHDRLAPVGAVAEVIIEGPILARCYLNQPDLTEQAFIENPEFTLSQRLDLGPRRMYKTGDLARYNADGSVSFVRRKNIQSQVKLRGQRIELGEIDFHLWGNEWVKHGVAFMPASGPFKGKLLAAVSLQSIASPSDKETIHVVSDAQRGEVAITMSQVREYLANHLPSYMMPEVWVVLEHFPLNTSGKMDRKRVIAWIEGDLSDEIVRRIYNAVDDSDPSQQAATGIEKKLQAVWSKVLNRPIEKVPINQSFASLGGDSITAMQVVSTCRATESIVVTVQDVLRCKSISQLAFNTHSAQQSTISKDEELDVAFALTPIQQMHFDLAVDGSYHYNQSFMVSVAKEISVADLKKSIEAIVRQHSMLRARFTRSEDGKTWTQRITMQVEESYRLKSYNISNEEEMRPLMLKTQESLDFQQGPLLAVDFIHLNGKQFLSLVAHHLVIDFVSWRVILQDLEQLLASGTLQYDEKPFPFQTWSRLQEEYSKQFLTPQKLVGDVQPTDYAFWGMEGVPNLFGDVMHERFVLDEMTTSALLEGCHEALRTEPLDIMIAALSYSFAQKFGRSTPSIYIESHGREPWDSAIDLSRTVGWFTTMYPITLAKVENIIEAVRQAKDLRRRTPNRGWSYFTSRYLNEEGKQAFGHHGMPEILFNYLGVLQQLERTDGLLHAVELNEGEYIDIGAEVPRSALFDIAAKAEYGRLQFHFFFNKNMNYIAETKDWMQAFKMTLEEAAEQLILLKREYTLGDFPLMDFTYDELQQFVAQKLPQVGITTLAMVEDVYPCSPMQNGILLSQSKTGNNYQSFFLWELKPRSGPFDEGDMARFKEAWQDVVDRHPSLRTRFMESLSGDSAFHQVVLKAEPVEILRLNGDPQDPVEVLKQHHQHFQYQSGRLHHMSICIGDRKAVCKLEINHAIVDGISIGVLVRDLEQAFSHTLRGTGPLYSSYISYLQREQNLKQTDAHWKNYLSKVEPCYFPAFQGQKLGEERGDLEVEYVQLSRSAAKLREFCSETGITVSNVIQLVWAIVLRSYTGQDDISFGYLTSGRDASVPGIQDAIGAFINMLICRLDIQGTESVMDLLEKVQDDFLANLPHQYTSLAEIQHTLPLGGKPLFNTSLSVQRAAIRDDAELQLKMERVEAYDPTEYDVTVNVEASDEDVQMVISYWNAQMSRQQALLVTSLFSHTLNVVLGNPDAQINHLNLIDDSAGEQIQEWNKTVNIEADSIEDKIRSHSVERPDSVAISAPDATLTYAELDHYSSLMTQYLVECGATAQLVSIHMENSAWGIVCMLAVLRADATFVLGQDSSQYEKVKMTLVSRESPGSPPSQDNASIVVSQTFLDSLTTKSPVVSGDRDHIAFIIDGVHMDRQAFYTGIHQLGKSLKLNSGTRTLQLAPYTSNVSMTEIFGTLSHGGCIIVPAVHDRSIDIVSSIQSHNVNWACFSPSIARLMDPEEVSSLQTLLLVGEPAGSDNATLWAPKLDLFSGYWVKQACGFPLINKLTPNSILPAVGGPGGPCRIASPWNEEQLAPVGCVGQLILASPSLAREFVDCAITSPAVSGSPNGLSQIRLATQLRTGDLVRYAIDGTIELVRQKDDLFKVNGHQVQFDKIESHIRSFDYIRNVALSDPKIGICADQLTVMVTLAAVKPPTGDGLSPKTIHATGQNGSAIKAEISRIREAMLEYFPLYMIPTVWAAVDMLPLHASGVVDRARTVKFFENMDHAEYHNIMEEATAASNTLETSVEQKMREIWSRVLHQPVNQIGTSRSFLSLGGDSITAMQVVSQCRAERIRVTVRDVLRCRTVSDLASRAEVTGYVAPLEEDPETPFELSPIQQTHFELAPNGQNHYNQSFFGRIGCRQISPEELRGAIEGLIMQHPMLRAKFRNSDAGWMQTISRTADQSYCLNHHRVETISRTKEVILRTQRSLDIEQGPILAVDLFDISDDPKNAIFIVAHHLVVDLVSWQVMLRDLEILLQKQKLQTPSTSFQAWSRLKAGRLESITPEDVLPINIPEADYAYWGLGTASNTTGEASHEAFGLSQEHTKVLLGSKGSAALRVQPIDIILGAVAHAFVATFTDRSLPAIFNEGHGREPWDDSIDLSDTVGWFTTLYPLHISHNKEEPILDAIRGFRDLRQQVPENGRPYFDYRYLTASGRQAFRHHAKAEIMLNYTGPYQHSKNANAFFEPIHFDEMSFAADIAAEMPRGSLIDILVKGEPDGMRFYFFYNKRMRQQEKSQGMD